METDISRLGEIQPGSRIFNPKKYSKMKIDKLERKLMKAMLEVAKNMFGRRKLLTTANPG